MRIFFSLLFSVIALNTNADSIAHRTEVLRSQISRIESHPDHYYKCLLEELPGTTDNYAAQAIQRQCSANSSLYRFKPLTWFGYDSVDECVIDKSEGTTNQFALGKIRYSCRKLYGK